MRRPLSLASRHGAAPLKEQATESRSKIDTGGGELLAGSGSNVSPAINTTESTSSSRRLSSSLPSNVMFPLPNREGVELFIKNPRTEIALAGLVVVSCVLFSLETLDGTMAGVPGGVDLGASALATVRALEAGVGGIFLAEYIGRWYYRGFDFLYLLTPFMLIDFLVVFPIVLKILGVPMIFNGVSFEFLRLLRVLRLQRFFNNPASFERTFGKVWSGAGNIRVWQLEVARILSYIATLLFVASGFMYEAEKNVNPEFSDFFATLYFGLTTLTTVGFGDIVPVTPAGRAVVGLSILFGITIIPVQLSALANAIINDSKLDFAVEDYTKNLQTKGSESEISRLSRKLRATLPDEALGVLREADGLRSQGAQTPAGHSVSTQSFDAMTKRLALELGVDEGAVRRIALETAMEIGALSISARSPSEQENSLAHPQSRAD